MAPMQAGPVAWLLPLAVICFASVHGQVSAFPRPRLPSTEHSEQTRSRSNCAAHSCCSNAAGGCCDADGVTACGGNSCTDGACAARACASCEAAAPPPPSPPGPPPLPPPPAPPAPPCTGLSAQLRQEDCDAWVQFFDATAGSKWLACSDARTDPCSCGRDPERPVPPSVTANVTCPQLAYLWARRFVVYIILLKIQKNDVSVGTHLLLSQSGQHAVLSGAHSIIIVLQCASTRGSC